MDGKIADSSCSEFAQALASRSSVPGGGGTAAFAGALGVALGEMAGNFTLGNDRYAEVEEDIRRALAALEAVRARLLELIDEDAAAFEPLSRAYGISRDDPARSAEIERATKVAVQPPLEMMGEIAKAIELLEEMGEKGSRMLVSDVGCGAALCRAALEAASLNVLVNTIALADRAFAGEVDSECGSLLAEFAPRAEVLVTRVAEEIREGR